MDLSQGDLVMLLCLQFIRFSVSSINQDWTLFLHTGGWGRHTGNGEKLRRGLDVADGDFGAPMLIPLFFNQNEISERSSGGSERGEGWIGKLRLKLWLSLQSYQITLNFP